jgi:RNA polymerase sigma factor (sigma-70 family)
MPAIPPVPDDAATAMVELVQHKVRQYLGRLRRPSAESEDLIQDVLTAVLAKLHRFDAQRATLATFVARIAETTLLDLSERASAAKRDPRRERSLDAVPSHRSEDTANRRPPKPSLQDLALDLAEAIRQLPPELRQVAEGIGVWSIGELAEQAGVHRGTIYRRLDSIRRRWEDGTLRDYLDS